MGRSHEVSSIEKFINDTETFGELRRLIRLINHQRLIRDRLKRKLASNRDQGVGNDDEHSNFLERIKEYEDCIRFNIAEATGLATKYGVGDDFYVLPEKNNFFFKPEESPYLIMELMELFFLVIPRIKISSINILGIGIRFKL